MGELWKMNMIEKESVEQYSLKIVVLEGYLWVWGYFISLVLLLAKSKVQKSIIFSLKRTF